MLSKLPPITTPYNVSVRDTSLCVFRSNYGRKNMVLGNLGKRVSGPVRVRGGEVAREVHATAKEVMKGLRLGGLTEDGLSYKEKFVIRCYEVGINKTATIETIANLLQEVGGNHAQGVGFSTDGFATTTTMRKLHLIWVTARMHIEVYRYPAWSDVIEIETWVQGDGKIGTRRDWILKDYANGEVIGRATSKWVMMNEDTRRLQKVSDDVREEYLVYCPSTLRLAFPEPNNSSLKKITKLEDPAEHSRLGLVPRRSDLDMNKHVNNVTYIGWALEFVGLLFSLNGPLNANKTLECKYQKLFQEQWSSKKALVLIQELQWRNGARKSIPPEIIDTHELQAITLDYRRECQQDDIVDSLTSLEPLDNSTLSELTYSNGSSVSKKDGQDLMRFLHLLQSSGNGLEINRCRTQWRKKPAKR